MKSSSGLVAGVLLFVAVPALAQATQSTQSSTDSTAATQSTTATPTPPSLSDLAKQAQEKKAGAPAKKTFTNDDLKGITVPPSPADAAAADGKAASSKDGAKPGDAKNASASGDAAKSADANKDDASNPDPAKTEKWWHDRMDSAREDVRRNESFGAALQSRINALTADFTARDDPYQRAQIADDRQKALAELDRVNKAIDDGKKTIANIEEEARKAMIPAGWIR